MGSVFDSTSLKTDRELARNKFMNMTIFGSGYAELIMQKIVTSTPH